MDILLWRHAEAEDGPDDQARQLTARGRKQARAVAGWIRKNAPAKMRILVSPAVRAQQTAAALELPFDTAASIGPAADAVDLLKASGWPGRRDDAILLVGHQPTLGELAALLLTGSEAEWTIKKGAVWWFSRRGRGDEGETVLRAVIGPELLG